MTAASDLRAALNGQPSAGDLCRFLSEQLGVDEIGLQVTSADVFGRGPGALVDVGLSDGQKLRFERFSDVAKPGLLSAHLVTLTGIYRTYKGPEAGAVAAAIFRLARHHAEASADEVAREWGYEFLRLAPTLELDLNDQAERWRAFEALARVQPARDAGDDRSSFALAVASTVVVDRQSGQRLVRTGWFQAYVKREVGGLYSPAALDAQMQAVGWRRRGTQGRVKATCPSDGRELVWKFYTVDAGWEGGSDESSG